MSFKRFMALSRAQDDGYGEVDVESFDEKGYKCFMNKRGCIEFLKEKEIIDEGDVLVDGGLRTRGFRKLVEFLKEEVFDEDG